MSAMREDHSDPACSKPKPMPPPQARKSMPHGRAVAMFLDLGMTSKSSRPLLVLS